MTLQEAIEARHSVRAYKNEPLTEDVVTVLKEQIVLLNREGNLHMQLILNEPKAFKGTMAKYGKFRNANNYIVMAGKKADDLDERIGANAVPSPGTLLMPKTIVRRLELIEQYPL